MPSFANNRLHNIRIERSKTKIADAFVAAVVSARDFHRHARDRDIQVGKGNGDVADLELAFDDEGTVVISRSAMRRENRTNRRPTDLP